jgi:hypothetical protein
MRAHLLLTTSNAAIAEQSPCGCAAIRTQIPSGSGAAFQILGQAPEHKLNEMSGLIDSLGAFHYYLEF